VQPRGCSCPSSDPAEAPAAKRARAEGSGAAPTPALSPQAAWPSSIRQAQVCTGASCRQCRKRNLPWTLACVVTAFRTIGVLCVPLKVTESMPQRKARGGEAPKEQRRRHGRKQGTPQRKGAPPAKAAEPKRKATQKPQKARRPPPVSRRAWQLILCSGVHTLGVQLRQPSNDQHGSASLPWGCFCRSTFVICVTQAPAKRSGSGKRKKEAAVEAPKGPPPKEIDANGEEVYYVRPCIPAALTFDTPEISCGAATANQSMLVL
jgi:hypothetical protein